MDTIVLASASPRRRQILEDYNIKHRVVKSNISEKIDANKEPREIAMSLAFQKAHSIALDYKDSIVIGADTIVEYKGMILGKPKDEDEAIKMLKILNGKEHNVITGISLIHLNNNIKVIEYEETKVKFRNLEEVFIKKYVNTKEPLDKAGAYGIQGYGALLVEKIEGCYLNVVGLPLSKLQILLYKYFNISIL
jgi:nucleoside triphosphate pyrophosphatase